MHIQINFVQQCIQISTRINSSSVHTYICVCFIRNVSNNSTWCQNRGCSYISSRRRIYRSNPAVSCIAPSILNISTVEFQFYNNFQEGRKTVISAKCHWIQGLQSSSTRQNLHSKQQQGSPGSLCAVPRAYKHSTRQKLHSMWPEVTSSSLWCSHVAVEEEFQLFFTG